MRKKHLYYIAVLAFLVVACPSLGQSAPPTLPSPPAVTGKAAALTPTADTRPTEHLSDSEKKIRTYFDKQHQQNEADFSKYKQSILDKYKSVPKKDKHTKSKKTP